jgi:hypothetical protein
VQVDFYSAVEAAFDDDAIYKLLTLNECMPFDRSEMRFNHLLLEPNRKNRGALSLKTKNLNDEQGVDAAK